MHSPEFVHSFASMQARGVLPVQHVALQRCFAVQASALTSPVTVLSCKMQPVAAVHEFEFVSEATSTKFWPSSVIPQNDVESTGFKHSAEQLAGLAKVEQSNQLHFSTPVHS